MHRFTKTICMIFRTKLIPNLQAYSYLSQKIILYFTQYKLIFFIRLHLHERNVLFSAKQSRVNLPVNTQHNILNSLCFIFYSYQG